MAGERGAGLLVRERASFGHGREKDIWTKEAPAPPGALRDGRWMSPPHRGAWGSGLKGLVQGHQLGTELLGLSPDLPTSQTRCFSHQPSERHPWWGKGVSTSGKGWEAGVGRGTWETERGSEKPEEPQSSRQGGWAQLCLKGWLRLI